MFIQKNTENSMTEPEHAPLPPGKFMAPIPRRILSGEFWGNTVFLLAGFMSFLRVVYEVFHNLVPDFVLGLFLAGLGIFGMIVYKFFFTCASYVKYLGDSVRDFNPNLPEN